MGLASITDVIDPQQLLRSFGTIGLFAIIFAESGLLFGFFLPGDSLLFTAGLFAAKGDLNLAVILVGCFLAAVIGDQVGYAFGKKVGPSIFRRENSRLFKQEYIQRADEFFEAHGAKTILLARFVPVVRTFVPILAGVGSMRYRTFLIYNVIGGLVWAVGVTYLRSKAARPSSPTSGLSSETWNALASRPASTLSNPSLSAWRWSIEVAVGGDPARASSWMTWASRRENSW